MRPPKAERLEVHQERCLSVSCSSLPILYAPLIHSFLSSPIPSHSSLRPSTISIHISLTIFSAASAGNRYANKL